MYILRLNAYLYIHGHSAGGTNPTLVEAMNFGTPILAYDVVFNRTTTFEQAVYFNTSSALIEHLLNLKSEDYERIGTKMKQLAAQHYTWKYITEQYATTFKTIMLESVDLEVSSV